MRRGHALLGGLCGLAAAVAVGCGSGERQDANEAEASYDVEVVDASFPERHRLAQKSQLEITVRNEGTEAIPDIAVTLDGLDRRLDRDDVADADRPVFVVDGRRKQIGGYPEVKLAGPGGGPTALVNTWTLGRLEPGAEKTFRWHVTAVEAGPFELTWAVSAGLHGNAEAVSVGGAQPRGKLQGTITSKPPSSRIAADGVTVVNPAP
ncbi:MAG: hypothetical protein WD399_11250 [Thermoleophilaceae bacterium]